MNPLLQACFPSMEPVSTWKPSPLPDIGSIRGETISLDLETRDENLKELGPGGWRKDGCIMGFAVGFRNRGYYIHKPGASSQAWVRDALRSCKEVVFANALYDLEWLHSDWGFTVDPTKIRDIQIAEPLIDENQFTYSLDALGKKYCFKGKDEELLNQALSAFSLKSKDQMWMLPPQYVGPYAEEDARLTLNIWNQQQEQLKDLREVFELECCVTPILHDMRRQGVRIDKDKAYRLSEEMQQAEIILLSSMPGVDIWSNHSIARLCSKLGVQYPFTDKGNPSFEGSWLEAQGGQLAKIAEARELNRIRSAFLHESILDRLDGDGILRCTWHQLRDSEGGTRTGRMSASKPNFQQMPARSAWGKKLRSIFVTPNRGPWIKMDYSQQEPRLLVHYGVRMGLPGAQEVADSYAQGIDLYSFLTTTLGITRDKAKMLTLALIYGMQDKSLSVQLKCSEDEAKALRQSVYKRIPFLEAIVERAKSVAGGRGYIKTLGGRRCRFDEWRPSIYSSEPVVPVMGEARAKAKWPGKPIARAGLHKSLNRLIQGSAADMTKVAMVEIRRHLNLIPMMAVHDELDYEGSVKEGERIRELAETCVKLAVPVKADVKVGRSWATD